MMIEYPDTCVISRSSGKVDEEGFEIRTTLYSGECLAELIEYYSRYDGFEFEHESKVFIPINDIIFKVNDKVIITMWNGTVYEYTIKVWESICDDEFEELNDTCLWLKDGKQKL